MKIIELKHELCKLYDYFYENFKSNNFFTIYKDKFKKRKMQKLITFYRIFFVVFHSIVNYFCLIKPIEHYIKKQNHNNIHLTLLYIEAKS